MMKAFNDVFISYGRVDSREFAAELTQRLGETGLKVWFDFEDIPLGVDYQKQIDDAIDKTENFVFIISPHSVNSPYCQLELNLALERNKRILTIMHIGEISRDTWQQRNPQGTDAEWQAYTAAGLHSSQPNMHPGIRKINWVSFGEGSDDFEKSLLDLLILFDRDRDYVHQHTVLLNQALDWENNNRLARYLLVEKSLQEAETWLQTQFVNRQPPCRPTKLHCQFISESLKNAQDGMTEVFICHAEEDRATLEQIYESLTQAGLTVWTSWHDIQMGKDFQAAIYGGIETADNFIYLLSPESVQSPWCQREFDYALGLNKRIIPILIKPLEPQFIPAEIVKLQFVDLTDNRHATDYREDEKVLLKTLSQDADYLKAHKHLLVKALKWERQLRNPSVLLSGKELRQTVAWLQVAQKHAHHRPLPIQEELVQASLEQPADAAIDVFIASDARDLEFARKLNETLQIQGERTWFESERTEIDAEYVAEVKEGIARADNCIFIISPDALEDPELLAELAFAESLSKRILAVSYRGVDEAALPPALSEALRVDFTPHNEGFLGDFGVLFRMLKSYPEHVREHTRLLNRALDWQDSQQDDSLLLIGKTLTQAEHWLHQAQAKIPQPSELQQAYVKASRGLACRKVKPRTLLSLGMGTTVLVLVARLLGLLQGVELVAYDHILRQRPNEPQDERFLVVTIDNPSGSYLRDGLIDGRFAPSIGTLPDDALNEVLTLLNANQARLIGLDFYRDFPAQSALAQTLRTTDNLITPCKRGQDGVGITKAPEVSSMAQVGFSDALGDRRDGGNYLRRHYLMDGADPKFCDTNTSLSLRLAQRYLEQEGIEITSPVKPGGGFRGHGLKLGDVVVPNLSLARGPYYNESDLRGYQTLLKFRTAPSPDGSKLKDPRQFAPQVSLESLLTGQVPQASIEDRIVLIGYIDESDRNADVWDTPYGSAAGVFLQGQKTSQLISAAQDGRSLIRWLSPIGELIWIAGWAFTGGMIVRQGVRGRRMAGNLAIALLMLYGSYYVAMVYLSVWIPFFPPLLAFGVTAGGVSILNYRLRHPS
jgi:CHASE2 domain-containing sensor protein